MCTFQRALTNQEPSHTFILQNFFGVTNTKIKQHEKCMEQNANSHQSHQVLLTSLHSVLNPPTNRCTDKSLLETKNIDGAWSSFQTNTLSLQTAQNRWTLTCFWCYAKVTKSQVKCKASICRIRTRNKRYNQQTCRKNGTSKM